MASCKSQPCGRNKNNIFVNSHRTTIAFWVDAEETISGAQGGSKKTKNANPRQEFHWASAPTNEANRLAGIVVFYIKSRPKLGPLGGRPRSLIPKRLGWRQNMKIRSRAFSDSPGTRSMIATLPAPAALPGANHLTVHPPRRLIDGSYSWNTNAQRLLLQSEQEVGLALKANCREKNCLDLLLRNLGL